MSEALQVADRFAAALAAGDASALASALAPDAGFARLGRAVDGRDAVLAELLGAELYRRLRWRAATRVDGAVRLVADPDDPKREPGLVLTLAVADGEVRRIEQQRTPPVPPPAMPLALTPALRARIDGALAARRPMLVAHVDADGQPVLSFRGSVRALDDTRLSMWVRNAEGGFLAAIANNPRIALMYRDEDSKATYQFRGRARVVDDPPLREAVYLAAPEVERHHDFARMGVAVVIELDRVEGYAGLGPAGAIDRVLMLRG
jgi:hypothetical protein